MCHLMAEPRRKSPKMDTGNRSDGDGVSKPDPGHSKSAPIDDGGNGHSTSHPKLLAQDVFCSSSEFKDVVNAAAFVDKTLFIKEFWKTAPDMVLITAPSRFCRSTNMNMLKTFLEIEVDKDAKPICDTEVCVNYKLFQDHSLKIYTEQEQFFKEHFGKYPVIYVDFKRVEGTSFSEVLDELKFVLREAFIQHFYLVKLSHGQWVWKSRELLESPFPVEEFLKYCLGDRFGNLNEADVKSGLKVLSTILHTHFKEQVVALVDECDAPIMTAIHDEDVSERVIEEMVLFLNGLISEFLKSNVHVKRALLNASVCLAGVILPDANNIKTCRFLEQKLFSKSYGFTPEEVKVLLGKSQFEWLKVEEEQVEQWYNGYSSLNDVNLKMYSSWSVLNFLQESVLKKKAMYDSYWCDSAYVTTPKQLFGISEVIEVFKVLHENEEIEINVAKVTIENLLNLKKMVNLSFGVIKKEQIHFFLQFLSDCGCLNVVAKSKNTTTGTTTMTLKIPNDELRIGFLNEVYSESIFKEKYMISPDNINAYREALNSVVTSQEESSFVGLANAISNLFSDEANLPENEAVFHSILFVMAHNLSTLTASSEVSVKKARKSEIGKPPTLDMLVINGATGILFELKYNSGSAKAALTQIMENGYYEIFGESKYKDVKKHIYVGSHLAEDRKVTLCYLVDKTDVNAAKIVCSLDLDAASNVSVR